MANDNVQHGIDDNPEGDAGKGAALGGVGGAVVGALAGGPIGAVIGAVAGAAASGAGVAAVDAVDNDNTVSGVGQGATRDAGGAMGTGVGGHNVVTGGAAHTDAGKTGLGTGAVVGGVLGAAVGGPVGAVVGGSAGSLLGGAAGDATEAADETTTGSMRGGVGTMNTPATGQVGTGTMGTGADLTPGNNVPGVQTGGVTTAGTDTRGLTEKAADTLTGDRTDDKTGGRVL